MPVAGLELSDELLLNFSLDPVFEAQDTLALNGYGYTSDNPVGEDDPTGRMYEGEGSEGGCGSQASCDKMDQDEKKNQQRQEQQDAAGAENQDLDHCRSGGCEMKVVHRYHTDQQYVLKRANEYAAQQSSASWAATSLPWPYSYCSLWSDLLRNADPSRADRGIPAGALEAAQPRVHGSGNQVQRF